ncbi:MAG: hypothetical protein QM831_34170 [Kofleriaceae bacterium]
MKKILLLCLGACTTNSTTTDHLPSASLTPHTEARESGVACGDDLTFAGSTSPDARYTYSYDANGLLVHADGVFTWDNSTDSIDYTWDSAERFTHMLETNDFGTRVEIGEAYQGDNPISYTETIGTDTYTYGYADFIAPWQPLHETFAWNSDAPTTYTLAYDNLGRLVSATPTTGDATTYTYDDAAGTITSLTGTYKYVSTYGSDWRLLSEAWSDSDASVIEGNVVYSWNGDQYTGSVYSSGSQDEPKNVQLIDTDTVRYDCDAARAGHTGRMITKARTLAASHALPRR